MHRNSITEIEKWNDSKKRKPLILMGARQVGKTWLMNEFAKLHYSGDTVSVNLMKMQDLRRSLEAGDASASAVIETIRLATDARIVPGKTLLIIDEIQESPNTLTSLKSFNEDMPELAVMAAGSLLGLSVGRALEESKRRGENVNEPRSSFPVGKVNFLNIRPMTFTEFVRATGKSALAEAIENGDPKQTRAFGESLKVLLSRYLVTGGMPESVAAFAGGESLSRVREVQNEILEAYDSDFAKHAPPSLLPKIRLLWHSIPSQLAKENKKFIYNALKEGARGHTYEEALQWLDDAGMVRQVFRVGAPGLPLAACRDFSAFKLYVHDVGLLGAMSGLNPSVVLDGNALFTNFKGALAEQYALQEMVAEGLDPSYWTPDSGNAEVEFVVQGERAVYPVEVKAGINLQAKSLKVYCRRHSPPFAIRTSLAPYSDGANVKDLPLPVFAPALRSLIQANRA